MIASPSRPRFGFSALTTFVVALLTWMEPAPLGAQAGMISQEECTCVDAEGNEIENCRCFRMFEPERFTFDFAPFQTSRARLGITLTMSMDEADPGGARVMGVMEDGPADRAGLRDGDVITHIDGRSLFDPLRDTEEEEGLDLDESMPAQRLMRLARALDPGDEVEIRYLREGEPRTTTVVAEELDEWGSEVAFWSHEEGPRVLLRHLQEGAPGVFSFEPGGWTLEPGERSLERARRSWLPHDDYLTSCPGTRESRNIVYLGGRCLGGLQMEELNPNLGKYFGTAEGVLVANVHKDSKLGLQAGDVILRVGDREATTPHRLSRIFRSYEPDEKVTLHIMRQKEAMTVSGTLGR